MLCHLNGVERARRAINAEYAQKPADADNYTRWGIDLLHLSKYGYDAIVARRVLKDATEKFGKAVEMNPTNHEVLWWQGTSHRALAFDTPYYRELHKKLYRKNSAYLITKYIWPGGGWSSRSLSAKHEPELHKVKHKNGKLHQVSQQTNSGGSASSSNAKHEPKLRKAKHKNCGLYQVGQLNNGGGFGAYPVAKPELELHEMMHKNGGLYQVSQQTLGEGSTSAIEGSEENKKSDLKYDILGCVMLAVGIVAWIAMGASSMWFHLHQDNEV